MNTNNLNFLIRPLIIVIIFVIAGYLRARFSKPKVDGHEQKPGKLQRIALAVLITIAVIFMLMAILGLIMGEMEMTLVSFVLALLMIGVSIYLKSALKTSYQENTDSFTLKVKNSEVQVFYENISDWKTSVNEIIIFDESKMDGNPIKVNIVFFKPEILLRTIADQTFEGKFYNIDKNPLKDPKREKEIVNFLKGNEYGYLIEDYIEEMKRRKKTF